MNYQLNVGNNSSKKTFCKTSEIFLECKYGQLRRKMALICVCKHLIQRYIQIFDNDTIPGMEVRVNIVTATLLFHF